MNERAEIAVVLAIATAAFAGDSSRLFNLAAERGLVQGVRSVEVIRNDILAMTVDAAITGRLNQMGPLMNIKAPTPLKLL